MEMAGYTKPSPSVARSTQRFLLQTAYARSAENAVEHVCKDLSRW